jgi:hypothetical protein
MQVRRQQQLLADPGILQADAAGESRVLRRAAAYGAVGLEFIV